MERLLSPKSSIERLSPLPVPEARLGREGVTQPENWGLGSRGPGV